MKVGDRVKVIGTEDDDTGKIGVIYDTGATYDWKIRFDEPYKCWDGGSWNLFNEKDLKIIKGGSMKDLKPGDYIFDEDGDKFLVLGVCDNGLWVSDTDKQPDSADCNTFTVDFEDFEDEGYTLNGQEEMTMEEVCRELGRTIKIKK